MSTQRAQIPHAGLQTVINPLPIRAVQEGKFRIISILRTEDPGFGEHLQDLCRLSWSGISAAYKPIMLKVANGVNSGRNAASLAVIKNDIVGIVNIEDMGNARGILSIGVMPEYAGSGAKRGIGIGTALMSDVLERGRRVFRMVDLSVRYDNAIAIALYEKFGFGVCFESPACQAIEMSLNFGNAAKNKGESLKATEISVNLLREEMGQQEFTD
jgi:ribosomal protein S18 acetylase RimI-like enzyme